MSTPPRERARRLRERGRTYPQIADELGVSMPTAYRWLNPDYEERQRERSRAWKERHRSPCASCGKPKAVDRRDEELCRDCQHELDFGARNRRIIDAWNAGETAAQIAAREGMTPTAVDSLMNTHRQRGKPIALHRRRDREAWDHILRRRLEGATDGEIAAELETSANNVNMMSRSMRAAGIELPPSPGLDGRGGKRSLTDEQVAEIRSTNGTLADAAERYGVSRTTIWRVRSHQTYA